MAEHLSIRVVTFNAGRVAPHPKALAARLRSSASSSSPSNIHQSNEHLSGISSNVSSKEAKMPDMIVLCIQEIAPIAHAFLGGSYLIPYLLAYRQAIALTARHNCDPSNNDRDDAAGRDKPLRNDENEYTTIVMRNCGLTAIMIAVRRSLAHRIRWMQVADVGVGNLQMGNKGAVAIRLGWAVEEDAQPDSSMANETSSTVKDPSTKEDTRIIKLCFVSAHLAPMEWNCERRNRDWENIVRGLVFEPIRPGPLSKSASHRLYEMIEEEEEEEEEEGEDARMEDPDDVTQGDHEDTVPLLDQTRHSFSPSSRRPIGLYHADTHLIVAGDLNYRTSSKKPDPVDQAHFPQPCPDDSYPLHYWHLLSSDQLSKEKQAGRTCHGLEEVSIDFPPTYKYSDQAQKEMIMPDDEAEARKTEQHAKTMDTVGREWKWASHRFPSWCDRILYKICPNARTQLNVDAYEALPLMSTSDHRPVSCRFSIIDRSDQIHDSSSSHQKIQSDTRTMQDSSPFPLNPHWRRSRRLARTLEQVIGALAFVTTMWNPAWQIPILAALAWLSVASFEQFG